MTSECEFTIILQKGFKFSPKMQNAVLQNNLIEALDNVMLRAEEIVTDDNALTSLNMNLLKGDIRKLYKIICQIELAEFSPAKHSHQQTVESLRQELEELKQIEAVLHTQEAATSPKSTEPEVLSEPHADSQTELTAEPAVANAENAENAHSASGSQGNQTKIANTMPDNTDKPADMPATEPDTTEQCPETPIETQSQAPGPQNKTPELPFSEEEFQQSPPENAHTAIELEQEQFLNKIELPYFPHSGTQRSKAKTTEESKTTESGETGIEASMTETPAQASAEPETSFSNAQSLSDFMPQADEDPQSYVTEITAMVQANTKEQDMSQVAVSSTAMPDEKVAQIVANRWNSAQPENHETGTDETTSASPASSTGIFSKLKETEALNRDTPQSSLKNLFEKLKSHKTVNDARQRQVQDIKSLIGLNEKFLFINKLFKGNIDDYRKMLEEIDKATSRHEMENIVAPLKEQYQWDSESLAYITLFDLLDKKFPEA